MACLRAGRATTSSVARTFDGVLAPYLPAAFVPIRGAKKAHRRQDVVLHEDVEGLGQMWDVVSVRPGHARNHLVPQKLAKYPTPANLAHAEEMRAAAGGTEDEGVQGEDLQQKVRHSSSSEALVSLAHAFSLVVPRRSFIAQKEFAAEMIMNLYSD